MSRQSAVPTPVPIPVPSLYFPVPRTSRRPNQSASPPCFRLLSIRVHVVNWPSVAARAWPTAAAHRADRSLSLSPFFFFPFSFFLFFFFFFLFFPPPSLSSFS